VKTYLTVYFGTVLVAMFLVPIVSRLAKRYRLVDAPGPRKVHQKPIPRIGGIVFVLSTLALVLPVFFLNNNIGRSFREARTEFIVLLVGASFMFMVGLIDDLRSLRGYIKLLCLTAASLAICASGATMRSVSVGTWFVLETGWAAWPLTVFWIVIITVCLSVIDGLDGLAAGIAAIVCGSILLLALWSGEAAMAVLMLALLGSVTGFLFFNFYPAKIFMGDSGSMFLGFMIGAGSIICQTKTSTLVGLAIPFLVMGVPILDTGFVVIGRRILERRSIFASDRNHLHHRLLDLGLNHRTVVIVIYAVTAIGACIGVFMLTMESKWSVGLLVGGLLLLFSMFACLHGRRYRGILKALKRNWVLAHEARTEKRSFENAQVRMRESRSFHAWWEAVCVMAQKMHFQSIGVWKRCNGHYVNTCAWNTPEDIFTTDKTMKLILPLNGNGTAEWEIRARIWADSYLELSGRQAMLLGRLMDEFPPPEQEEEAEALDQLASTTRRTTIKEKTGLSLMTMTNTQTLKMPADIPAPLNILGIPVIPFDSYSQAVDCIASRITARKKTFCVALNPEKVYRALYDPVIENVLRNADIGICDGIGICLAAWIIYGKSIRRCTGVGLFMGLLDRAAVSGWQVFLLGASPDSNEQTYHKLEALYPGLRIVGRQHGYFGNGDEVVKQINDSKAELVFVAMGSPKQELWISENHPRINAPLCMGVGGAFDIISGKAKRAPWIFRQTGTEFLFRLVANPGRWKRQILYPAFMFEVFRRRFYLGKNLSNS
jgi:exopolysaccharide biosynthesis WecB/TagA/CpsF family protein